MKQTFSQEAHEKFKSNFHIKSTPSQTDKELFEKTYKYIPYIKWIPGIQFIGVGNSTSMFASNKESDIDLFIITAEKRMWFVRILSTFIFQILGVRKTGKYHEKRFCLSFFATTKEMNFQNFALENDIYLYFWIIYLKPILDFDNTYTNFLKSQSWCDIQNFENIITENKNFIKYSGKSFGNNSKILDIINTILEKIFLPKTLKSYLKLNKPYGIIISENMLKFHDNDRRKEIKKELFD
ncbi:MAG: hypothetical protein AB7E37_03805 [Candidatus Altimarinota bacterium]